MQDLIPARYRAHAYRIFALVGIALGAVQVGYASAGAGQPTALTVALAVYAFVGGALGFIANANTPKLDVPGGPVTVDEAYLLDDIRRIEGRDEHAEWDDEPGSDDLRGERA